MKKFFKYLTAVACVVTFALGFGLMSTSDAALAETSTDGFYMSANAGVYVDEQSGIAFKTNIDKTWFESIKSRENYGRIQFHTLVTRLDEGHTTDEMLAGTQTIGNRNVVDIESPFYITDASFAEGSTTADYVAVINYSDLEEANQKAAYATELSARSYAIVLDKNGDTLETVYAANAGTWSIKDTANLLILQGDTSEGVAKYTDTNFVEAENVGAAYYSASASYGKITVSNELGTVTDVVVDGKRIDSSSYEQSGSTITLKDLSLESAAEHAIAIYDQAADTYYKTTFVIPSKYDGTVYYSTVDDVLYRVSSTEAAVRLTDATVTSAKGETVDITNTAKTEKKTSVLLTIGNDIYTAEVQSFEKVITKAEDFAYFNMCQNVSNITTANVYYTINNISKEIYLNGEKVGTGTLDTNNEYGFGAQALIYANQLIDTFVTSVGNTSGYKYSRFGGRYIIANDIDASNYTLSGISFAPAESNNNKGPVDYRWCGMQGIFDGNGHIVSGMTIGCGGIFGNMNGVVQNVAFVGVKFANSDNIGVMASYMVGQLNNVYLQADKLAQSANGKCIGLVAGQMNPAAKITNCIFNLKEAGTVATNASSTMKRYGALCGGFVSHNDTGATNISNNWYCTVISDVVLTAYLQSGNTYTLVAQGEDDSATNTWRASNVVRYNDAEALTTSDVYETFKTAHTEQSGAAGAMWVKIFATLEA